METDLTVYDPQIAGKEEKKKAKEEKKSWRKVAIISVLIMGLFIHGYFSVVSNEVYAREHKFGPDSVSPNITSFSLTADGFGIDYMADGNSYSTTAADAYSVEMYQEDKTGIDRRLAQKNDGHFYNADFDYASGKMKIVEGVIFREEIHYYMEEIDCSIGYNVFEKASYDVTEDNTVITTFTPSIRSYVEGFFLTWGVLALIVIMSYGEKEIGRGCG